MVEEEKQQGVKAFLSKNEFTLKEALQQVLQILYTHTIAFIILCLSIFRQGKCICIAPANNKAMHSALTTITI